MKHLVEGTEANKLVDGVAKEVFKVVVAGGRDYDNYDQMEHALDLLLRNKYHTHTVEIISGCAKGADTLAIRYAQTRGLTVIRMPADWDRHGRAAGMVRNGEMLKLADAVVIFWDGVSRGSGDMFRRATDSGKPVRVIRY